MFVICFLLDRTVGARRSPTNHDRNAVANSGSDTNTRNPKPGYTEAWDGQLSQSYAHAGNPEPRRNQAFDGQFAAGHAHAESKSGAETNIRSGSNAKSDACSDPDTSRSAIVDQAAFVLDGCQARTDRDKGRFAQFRQGYIRKRFGQILYAGVEYEEFHRRNCDGETRP